LPASAPFARDPEPATDCHRQANTLGKSAKTYPTTHGKQRHEMIESKNWLSYSGWEPPAIALGEEGCRLADPGAGHEPWCG
jgi:hypothetical protein